jgi:hypothetical protein
MHHVVEHLLLDVQHVECAARLKPPGHRQGIVARSWPHLQDYVGTLQGPGVRRSLDAHRLSVSPGCLSAAARPHPASRHAATSTRAARIFPTILELRFRPVISQLSSPIRTRRAAQITRRPVCRLPPKRPDERGRVERPEQTPPERQASERSNGLPVRPSYVWATNKARKR